MDTPVNRKYKDRLFRFLFGTEERKSNLLSLYNALNESHYDDPNDLEFTTIQDFIYMGYKNDVSFLVEDYMNLYEHQSTFNPNMPLRGLLYYTSMYDRYIETHNLNIFSSKPLKLPTPHYVVFYNGDEDMPDRKQLKLSDLFINPSRQDDCYEWTATMLNINLEHNQRLMEQCRPLWEYAYFVDRVKKHKKTMGVAEAIDLAVKECINQNIMTPILSEHRMEVTEMLMTEYDEAKVRKMFIEEGREEERQRAQQQRIKDALSLADIIPLQTISERFSIPLDQLKTYSTQQGKPII